RRAEQLQHEPPAVADAISIRAHHHAWFDLPRAGRRESPRALHLDDAQSAGVDRRQRLQVAQRRRLDPDNVAGLENRRAIRRGYWTIVNRQLDHRKTCSFLMADWTAVEAVCPRPQIDASRIASARSSIRATSC